VPVETAFRHAAWDTPWWVNPNRNAGRYNRAGDPPTQYWCLHPLGPAAELLRALGPMPEEDLATIRLRLWAARVEIQDLPEVTFDNAGEFGVTAESLVAEDHESSQDLAQRMRDEGRPGLVAPSAALPGTRLLVLFGPRLLFPYLLDPVDPEDQVPTAHAAESLVPEEVVPFVRRRGGAHATLDDWRVTGASPVWRDPAVQPWPTGHPLGRP
jgi:hypothetical protein